MQLIGKDMIQAIEWKKGCFGVTTGTYKTVQVLHCLTNGNVTAHFPEGDESADMVAGTDVVLDSVDITINTGSWAFN